MASVPLQEQTASWQMCSHCPLWAFSMLVHPSRPPFNGGADRCYSTSTFLLYLPFFHCSCLWLYSISPGRIWREERGFILSTRSGLDSPEIPPPCICSTFIPPSPTAGLPLLWILGCKVLFCLFYQHFTIFFFPGNTDGAQCPCLLPQLGCLTITTRAREGKQDDSSVARAVQREESSYLSFFMEGFSARSASRLFFFLFFLFLNFFPPSSFLLKK